MNNPTESSLENILTFNIEARMPFRITMSPRDSEFNEQITNQRWGCQKIKNLLTDILYKNKEILQKHNIEIECQVECFPKDKEWNSFQERCFNNMLFFGNGDYSIRNAEVLKTRLEEAMNILSGLQQGAEDEEAYKFIENIVKDVAMALTGKEIEFKE